MVLNSSLQPKSAEASALTVLCMLSVVLFSGLAVSSVLNVPDEVHRSVEIVDIAGAQRRNALSLLLTVQDAGAWQGGNDSRMNSSISDFQAREQEIKTYLNAQTASRPRTFEPVVQAQEMIDIRIAQLLEMLPSDGVASPLTTDMEQISRFIRGAFSSDLDERVKQLTAVITDVDCH